MKSVLSVVVCICLQLAAIGNLLPDSLRLSEPGKGLSKAAAALTVENTGDSMPADLSVDSNYPSEYPPAQSQPDFGEKDTVHSIIQAIAERDRSSKETESSVVDEITVDYAEELRALWFSYLDWSKLFQGKSEGEMKDAVQQVYENMASLHLNTIIIHVSAYNDAMYPSEFLPWSHYVTGSLGKDPAYDPFSIIVEEAHKHGIAVHAWINPMRTFKDEDFNSIGDQYQIKQWYGASNRSEYMVKDTDGRYWLNPGNGQVCEYIGKIAFEIAEKYDVQALHIDDYFYPASWDKSQDQATYESAGTSLSIEDWRRENTSNMVRTIYTQVKTANSQTSFGVSPQGNLENNYNKMYINVENWLSEGGYVDYIMPQIYYGFQNEKQPFEACSTQWSNLIRQDSIKLYIGLSASKIQQEDAWAGASGKDEWKINSDILKRSIEYSRTLGHYSGIGFFSYSSLFDTGGVRENAKQEVDNFIGLFQQAK